MIGLFVHWHFSIIHRRIIEIWVLCLRFARVCWMIDKPLQGSLVYLNSIFPSYPFFVGTLTGTLALPATATHCLCHLHRSLQRFEAVGRAVPLESRNRNDGGCLEGCGDHGLTQGEIEDAVEGLSLVRLFLGQQEKLLRSCRCSIIHSTLVSDQSCRSWTQLCVLLTFLMGFQRSYLAALQASGYPESKAVVRALRWDVLYLPVAVSHFKHPAPFTAPPHPLLKSRFYIFRPFQLRSTSCKKATD